MLLLENKTSSNYDTKLLQEILQTQSDKDVELIITNNEEIQNYNKTFRNIDSHTDVLSFPIEPFPKSPLGSIVISNDYVIDGASKYSHAQEDELALLFIHGLLHLLGLDHEIDNGEMRKKEEEIIKSFKLPDSLIIRKHKNRNTKQWTF